MDKILNNSTVDEINETRKKKGFLKVPNFYYITGVTYAWFQNMFSIQQK